MGCTPLRLSIRRERFVSRERENENSRGTHEKDTPTHTPFTNRYTWPPSPSTRGRTCPSTGPWRSLRGHRPTARAALRGGILPMSRLRPMSRSTCGRTVVLHRCIRLLLHGGRAFRNSLKIIHKLPRNEWSATSAWLTVRIRQRFAVRHL